MRKESLGGSKSCAREREESHESATILRHDCRFRHYSKAMPDHHIPDWYGRPLCQGSTSGDETQWGDERVHTRVVTEIVYNRR